MDAAAAPADQQNAAADQAGNNPNAGNENAAPAGNGTEEILDLDAPHAGGQNSAGTSGGSGMKLLPVVGGCGAALVIGALLAFLRRRSGAE